jgi:hypothetical protein
MPDGGFAPGSGFDPGTGFDQGTGAGPGGGFDPGTRSGGGGGFAFSPSRPSPSEDPQIIAWAQTCLAHIVGGWVPQDGTLGPTTLRAIHLFQGRAQLPTTGTLDDNTLSALHQVCEATTGAAPTAAPDQAPSGAPSVAPPSSGAPPPPAQGAPAAPPANTEFEASGATYEMEAPRRPGACINIPDGPYSDRLFHAVEKTVDVAEAVHYALEIFAVELAPLLGIAVGALTAFAAPFLAIGSGYAAARAKVSKQSMHRGYAWGVVTGMGGEQWDLVRSRLGRWSPVPNPADPEGGVIAQKAFNLGLATGYLCGRDAAWNPNKRKFFWDSIRSAMTRDDPNVRAMWHADVAKYGARPSAWPDRDWSDFYQSAMIIFTKRYVKDDGD